MNKRTDNLYLSLEGDRYTPFSLAKKLGAKAILESASFSQGSARYSILMLEEAFHVIEDEQGVAIVSEGQRKPCGSLGKNRRRKRKASPNSAPGCGNRIPLLRILRTLRHHPFGKAKRRVANSRIRICRRAHLHRL